MLNLYGMLANGWRKIDIALYEKDIVDTMVNWSDKRDLNVFKIENTKTDDIQIINGKEEFKSYLSDFKERTKPIPMKDMTCIELKRYILNKKKSSNS